VWRAAIGHAAVALALFAGADAGAFTIAPTAVLLEGSAPDPVKIRIAASLTAPLALELSIFARQTDGLQERLQPASALHVYPPQIFLAAGESTDITLRWAGEVGNESQSFYLIADELPVAFADDGAQQNLRFLARVHLPVHVSHGGQADLHIQQNMAGGQRSLVITNRGKRYARFSRLALRVSGTAEGTARTILGMELARAAQTDALLPGRTVTLPAAEIGIEPTESVLELVELQ